MTAPSAQTRSIAVRRVRGLAVALGAVTALAGAYPAVASASVTPHSRQVLGAHAFAGSRMTLAHAPAGLRIAVHRALRNRAAPAVVDRQRAEWKGASAGAEFGNSVAIAGTTAVVGAEGADSAYVFVRSTSGVWSQQAVLTDPADIAGDGFGSAVAISGTTAPTLVVGAFATNSDTGAAYVYTRSGSTWSQQGGALTASNGAAGFAFGGSVGVSNGYVVVGAPGWDGAGTGQAYVFKRSSTGAWRQQVEFTDPAQGAGDYFGDSVAIDNNTAVVGADGTSSGEGAAYVYTRSGTTWSGQVEIADSDAGDGFGSSAAIVVGSSTATAVVGAVGYNSYQGIAAAFTRSGTAWSQQGTMTATDGAADNYFGNQVALSGTTAVVGAFGHNSYTGAAYVFRA